jgi:hypothetical protein
MSEAIGGRARDPKATEEKRVQDFFRVVGDHSLDLNRCDATTAHNQLNIYENLQIIFLRARETERNILKIIIEQNTQQATTTNSKRSS